MRVSEVRGKISDVLVPTQLLLSQSGFPRETGKARARVCAGPAMFPLCVTMCHCTSPHLHLPCHDTPSGQQ